MKVWFCLSLIVIFSHSGSAVADRCAEFFRFPVRTHPPQALETKGPFDPKYSTPKLESQFRERFQMVTYDLRGRDINDPKVLAEIRDLFQEHGRVHVVNNTRYLDHLPESVIDALGFGSADRFKWGGQFSGRTVRPRLGKNFHAVDSYPAHLPVLAHNEIIYQPVAPRRLLFHYRKVSGEGNGGRTFVHSSEKLVEEIEKSGPIGIELLRKLRKHGQLIKTGFIDERHPERDKNYLRSWQAQFDTTDIHVALKRATEGHSYYDRVWIETLPEKGAKGEVLHLLMAESTIPMFKKDALTGKEHFIFPRLGYDGPHLANGFRQYLLGNGKEFTKEELDILLAASWRTREGIYQNLGDILIVDNLRFSHSREPFREFDENGVRVDRVAGILMAGRFYSDDVKGRNLENSLESSTASENELFVDPKDKQ